MDAQLWQLGGSAARRVGWRPAGTRHPDGLSACGHFIATHTTLIDWTKCAASEHATRCVTRDHTSLSCLMPGESGHPTAGRPPPAPLTIPHRQNVCLTLAAGRVGCTPLLADGPMCKRNLDGFR